MVMIRGKNQQQSNDQRGMAAIMVTMILAVVITVIVLGFAQVVRREQRNALDNQLSTQAYYAAESGINLAQSKLKANPALAEKTTCPVDATFNDFSVGQSAEITCLLVTRRLPDLQYQKVDMHSVPMLIKSEAGNIDRIYISWQASGGSTATAGCVGALPASISFGNAWPCPQPLLRLDLVPIGSTNPTLVANSQYTAFLYPTTGGGLATYNTSKDNIVAAQCDTSVDPLDPRVCTIAITGGLGQQAYAARLMSIYGDSDVTVFATDSGGTRRTLVDGQVLIDATAKASDVLKRLQARMSLTTGVPDFAITTSGEGICKRYQKIGTDISVSGVHPACNIP